MSRNPTTTVSNTSSYPTEPRVANILSTDHTVITLEEIQHESHSDSDYQTLISAINNNFHTSQCSTIPSIIKKYWEVHNPLSIETDIILMDTRILIPLTMRKNILQVLNSAHQAGIFPSTFVPPVPRVKNSILDSVLKLNPVKRKKINIKT